MMVGLQKIYNWWESKNVPSFLIIILWVVFILSLPSLLEPYWHGDEGIYLTIGQALRRGKKLYVDIYDNKTPAIYWLAAIAGRQFWLRFLGLVSRLAAVGLFYYLSRRLLISPLIRKIVTALFALLFSVPLLEANTANAEVFFVPLVLAGFLFFWRQKFFTAGLLLGGAFLFKSPPLFEFLVLVWFVWYWRKPGQSFGQVIKQRISPLVGGFILPVLLTVVYYAVGGNLSAYGQAAFLDNLSYLSSWGGGSSGGLLSSGLVKRAIVIGLAGLVLLWRRKNIARKTMLCACWSLGALFAVLLSARPYPHYLLQLLPPLLLLLGCLGQIIIEKGATEKMIVPALPVVLAIVGFFYYQFYFYPVLPYYNNFFSLLSGSKSREEYRNWFDKRMDRVYKVAEFLRTSTLQDDPVFVWGDEAMIYALSRRQPPTRFVVAYHLQSHFHQKDRYQKALEKLQADPPKVILYDSRLPFDWPALRQWLHEDYYRLESWSGLQAWYSFQ